MAIEFASLAYEPTLPGQLPPVQISTVQLLSGNRQQERRRQLEKHNLRIDVARIAYDFTDSEVERARLVAYGISGVLGGVMSDRRHTADAAIGIVRKTNVGARLKIGTSLHSGPPWPDDIARYAVRDTDQLLSRLSSPYRLDAAADDSHGAFVVPKVTAAIAIMDGGNQAEVVEAVKRKRSLRDDDQIKTYDRICAFFGPDAEQAAASVYELMRGFIRYVGYTALMVDAHSVEGKTAISVASRARGRLDTEANELINQTAGILRQIESPYQFQAPQTPAQLPA